MYLKPFVQSQCSMDKSSAFKNIWRIYNLAVMWYWHSLQEVANGKTWISPNKLLDHRIPFEPKLHHISCTLIHQWGWGVDTLEMILPLVMTIWGTGNKKLYVTRWYWKCQISYTTMMQGFMVILFEKYRLGSGNYQNCTINWDAEKIFNFIFDIMPADGLLP